MDLTNLVWQEFACPIQGVRANRVVQVRDVLQTIRASRMNVRWSAFQEAEGPLRVDLRRSPMAVEPSNPQPKATQRRPCRHRIDEVNPVQANSLSRFDVLQPVVDEHGA